MKEYSQSMEKTVDFNLCVGDELAKAIVDEYLSNEYEGGRHQRRIEKLEGEDNEQSDCFRSSVN